MTPIIRAGIPTFSWSPSGPSNMNAERMPRKPLSQKKFIEKANAAGMTYEGSEIDTGHFIQEVDSENFKELPSLTVTYIRMTADLMLKYLSYPTIADSITDHTERRAVRSRMGPAFEELYQKNKLKGGNMFSIHSMLQEIKKLLADTNVHAPMVIALNDLLASAPDLNGYDEKTLDEKRMIVKEMEQFCLKYLHIVLTSPKRAV